MVGNNNEVEQFSGKVVDQEEKQTRKNPSKTYMRLKIQGIGPNEGENLWMTAWDTVSRVMLSRLEADWAIQYTTAVLSNGTLARTIRKAEVASQAKPPVTQIPDTVHGQKATKGSISRGVAVNGLMRLAASGKWFKDLSELESAAPVFAKLVDLYESIADGSYVEDPEPIEEEDDSFTEVVV